MQRRGRVQSGVRVCGQLSQRVPLFSSSFLIAVRICLSANHPALKKQPAAPPFSPARSRRRRKPWASERESRRDRDAPPFVHVRVISSASYFFAPRRDLPCTSTGPSHFRSDLLLDRFDKRFIAIASFGKVAGFFLIP